MPPEQWGVLGQWPTDRINLGLFVNREGCVTENVSQMGNGGNSNWFWAACSCRILEL